MVAVATSIPEAPVTLAYELGGAILLGWLLAFPGRNPLRRLEWVAIAALLAMPLLQLVPLPYDAWAALPGRGLPAEILDAAGIPRHARPITFDRHATLASFLWMIPPVALYIAIRQGTAAELRLVVIALVAISAFSILLGLLQFATRDFYLRLAIRQEWAAGLYTNHNHLPPQLYASLLLGTVLWRDRLQGAAGGLVLLAAMGMVSLAVLATASRSGIIILPFALLGAGALSGLVRGAAIGRVAAVAAATLATLACVAWFTEMGDVFMRRFAATSEADRVAYWKDVLVAIRTYFPVGAGLGTFVPVYMTVENLDLVGTTVLNHAHNDYLEILLDGGVMALVVAGLIFAAIGASFVTKRWADPLANASLGGLALYMACSVTDYPLRTGAGEVVAAILAACIMAWPDREATARRSNRNGLA